MKAVKPDVQKNLAPSFDLANLAVKDDKAGPVSWGLHSQKSYIITGFNGIVQTSFYCIFVQFVYPEAPGLPQVSVDNVDTLPIDVMEVPTPEPAQPRPASFEDVTTKRQKYQGIKKPGSKTQVLGESTSPSSSTRAPTSTGTPSTENMSPPELATSDDAGVAPVSEPEPSKPKRRRAKKRSTIDFEEPMATPAQSPNEVADAKALCSGAGVQ